MTNLSPTVQALLDRVRQDPEGERNLYRAQRMASLARQLRQSVERRGLSVRKLAESMGTSASQAQRLLSMTSPANVTLDTLFRAADAMEMEVDFHLRDPLRSAFYVQRNNFPAIREFTCITAERTVRPQDPLSSEPLVSAAMSSRHALGGRYGANV
jgi:transcriptional regulator with XRE-family HTH domain